MRYSEDLFRLWEKLSAAVDDRDWVLVGEISPATIAAVKSHGAYGDHGYLIGTMLYERAPAEARRLLDEYNAATKAARAR